MVLPQEGKIEANTTLLHQFDSHNLLRIKLRESADSIGLPTFVVADAGKTQVAAGSKTVLAVGPVYHAPDSCLPSTVKYPYRDLIRIVLAIFNRRNADSCDVKHVFIR
ncbi:hypothetical protein ACFE04_006163 [Oxalis oulophora]